MNLLSCKILLVLLLFGLQVTAQNTKRKTIEFPVKGSCTMCKKNIENALQLEGVKKADWDINTKRIMVVFDPRKISEEVLHQCIANAGYSTNKLEANPDAYAQLPACCQYTQTSEKQHHEEEHSDEHDHSDKPHREEMHQEHSDTVRGIVVQQEDGQVIPVPGVEIRWKGDDHYVVSDDEGKFWILDEHQTHDLLITALTFEPVLLEYNHEPFLSIVLDDGELLEGVEVTFDADRLRLHIMDPLNTHLINNEELRKAACCNLGESFETDPSVDASFTNAVTGTKQIQMLGLAGKYVQIMQDNIPMVRGISSVQGLEYVPGAWLEGIQVSKGAGSVVNGYESLTGQINLDWKKPGNAEKLLINGYFNQGGRTELNVNFDQVVGKRWETTLLLHGKYNGLKQDQNNDGFLDNPLVQNLIVHNQWNYVHPDWRIELGAGYLQLDGVAGQIGFDPKNPQVGSVYGVHQKNKRAQFFAKVGYLFPKEDYKSVALQLSGSLDALDHTFDAQTYVANQYSYKANLIYQDELGSKEKHRFKTGVSFLYDRFDERVGDAVFLRTEEVPGIYYEHNWTPNSRWGVNAGMRADYHNLFDWFGSPRFHVRFSPSEHTAFKAMIGRGQRTANVFAENLGYFVSSRNWNLQTRNLNWGEGYLPEVAWNFGLNYTQKFEWAERLGTVAIDVYHTNFQHQLIVDLEHASAVNIYHLEGKSYSNSVQAEFNYEIAEGVDIRLAYRFLDVQADYAQGRLDVPFVSKHRAFMNMAYATRENDKGGQWKFDATTQLIGQKRLPNTSDKDPAYQLADYSPNYFLLNAQITWVQSNTFEWYIGGENLLHYRQNNPILASNDPFSDQFDAALVWAPIFGRMIYTGFRITLP